MANAYINISQFTNSQDVLYINTNKSIKADIITAPDTAIFTGASILQPSALLPATTINNFLFFINSQNIPSSFVSFNSYSGGVSITFNIASIGFSLETNDEVIAIGKFQ
jgi:hypothetical protein